MNAEAGVKGFAAIEDGRLNRRMPDQPYNLAMVTLDEEHSTRGRANLLRLFQVPGIIYSKAHADFRRGNDVDRRAMTVATTIIGTTRLTWS